MSAKPLMKVFFHPGLLSASDIYELLEKYPCVRIVRHTRKDEPFFKSNGIDVLYYPDYSEERLSTRLSADMTKLWSHVVDDHQTSILFDRTERVGSENFKFNEIFIMCCSYQRWLERERPDVLLFTATPHNIKTWVLSKVAEGLGIRILYFQASFFPWRQFLMEGVRRAPKILDPLGAGPCEEEYKLFSEYVSRKTGSLEQAMPAYEIDRLKKNNWRLLAPSRELRDFFKRPLKVIRKWRAYSASKQLAGNFQSKNYVAFFLHYQPERTTVPEGYGFGVQLAAILALQQSLPEGVFLVVKEHPSTYTYSFSSKNRSHHFYELLSSIERVVLAPISTDPYELIDNSMAVASITGTVIGEAFVRRKPAIAFGEGPIQVLDSPLFHRYQSLDGLRRYLGGLNGEGRADVRQYFEAVCKTSFSGVDGTDFSYDEKYRGLYSRRAIVSGVHWLLGEK